MTGAGVQLTVTHVMAMAYKLGKGEKRTAATNFLVELKGITSSGRHVVGVGESQPRDEATGDRLKPSWDFLEAAVRSLKDRIITIPSPHVVTKTVRDVMSGFEPLVARHAPNSGRLVPFRGTLVGIETALLDLACSALGVPLATVLGKARDQIASHAAPVPPQTTHLNRAALLRDQSNRYPAKRLLGTASVAESLELLESAAEVTGSGCDREQPLWMDLEGRLGRDDSIAFVTGVVEAIVTGKLPRQVLIEHPVPYMIADHVAVLQRMADEAAVRCGRSDIDVQIISDQSLWRLASLGRRARLRLRLRRLRGHRLPRAVNLRPAEVGGVLATIELAEKIRRTSPAVQLYLGAMKGATEVTDGLVRNLAMAVPGIIAVADDSVSNEPVVVAPTEPGIGARVPYDDVLGDITELIMVPEPKPPSHGNLAMNQYHDVDVIRPLGLNFTKGYLLEREALARGLSTRRFSRSAFLASDGVHEALAFKRSRTPLSSAVAMALCTHKEATRIRLQRAGVPVPRGATFAEGDYDNARAYIERIGFPVVVKPAMGVSGVGVAANIQDDEALEHAFDRLESTRFGSGDFIVEEHISGRDHRIVVVGDEVVGAILRDPASVDGDGERTVAELIVAKNVSRRSNPHLWGRPIKFDDAARYQLARAGLDLDSVPAPQQKVVLSNSGNLALGADSVDVLDDLHPSIKDACIRAVRAIPGLAYCGVDFLLEDHTRPLSVQQAAICELNAHAAIGNCEYPIYGRPREVARRIVDECIRQFDLAARQERATRLALKLTIRGKVTGVGYRAWMRRRALETGLSGWVRNVDERTAEAVVIGEVQAAAALAAAAISGPRAAAPTEVITTHLAQEPAIAGFQIVKRDYEGHTHVG